MIVWNLIYYHKRGVKLYLVRKTVKLMVREFL